jgi:formylglycine-generating enzyme required for sulfatase activity
MVDFFDAERVCQLGGKRLCLESEWVAACEGPSEKPFPYGWQRSSQHCNIDNRWLEPHLARVYSKNETLRNEELDRLDQSAPSGSQEGCVSDFGVFDLTGNFDEWVRLDQPKPGARSKMAGLKGGAWGHVRNACRPVTTSHAPEFTYYFISFRCCQDVTQAAASEATSYDP